MKLRKALALIKGDLINPSQIVDVVHPIPIFGRELEKAAIRCKRIRLRVKLYQALWQAMVRSSPATEPPPDGHLEIPGQAGIQAWFRERWETMGDLDL